MYKRITNLGILIFSIGIVLSPASKLRFPNSALGIGEIFILISIFLGFLTFLSKPVISYKSWSSNKKAYVKFWFSSFFLLMIGTVNCFLIGKLDGGSTLHNFAAFVFVFLSFFFFIFFYNDSFNQNFKNLLLFFTNASGVFFLLIFYILISKKENFYGYDMYFELRFSGFSMNPNQLAFSCLPLPFLSILYFKSSNSNVSRIWYVTTLFAVILVGLATLSDALIISWIFGFFTFYYFNNLKNIFNKSLNSKLKTLIITSIILVCSLLFVSEVRNQISEIYGNDVTNSQGSDRLLYWKNAMIAFTYSPIFGLGPGSYSGAKPFGKEEAHNSILDWLVSTGIIGLVLLSVLLINKWKYLIDSMHPEYPSIFVTLLFFSMFHLTLRHLSFWMIILFL